ncbi:hypothetical protein VTI74DRAFT_5268 [Chaetomium olivicolor]
MIPRASRGGWCISRYLFSQACCRFFPSVERERRFCRVHIDQRPCFQIYQRLKFENLNESTPLQICDIQVTIPHPITGLMISRSPPPAHCSVLLVLCDSDNRRLGTDKTGMFLPWRRKDCAGKEIGICDPLIATWTWNNLYQFHGRVKQCDIVRTIALVLWQLAVVPTKLSSLPFLPRQPR